jgi:L-fuconolactonase
MDSLPAIIDSHLHLWNPQRLRYAWLGGLPTLHREFLPEQFAAASASANVAKMIFVECGCESAQAMEEVDWVGALAKHEPRLCGIVAHAALEKGAAVRPDLQRLAARPLVKGVRRNLQGEAHTNFCLQPAFLAGVKLLAQFNFTFDLCIRHEQLCAVTELVRRVPEVQFVLDHFGKPPVKAGQIEPWAAHLNSLAKLPNVSCKISGLTTEADWQNWRPENLKPYFDIALQAFGPERVLFGSDWPVSTLATNYPGWLATVLELTAGAGESGRQKLFQLNAEKIYRI